MRSGGGRRRDGALPALIGAEVRIDRLALSLRALPLSAMGLFAAWFLQAASQSQLLADHITSTRYGGMMPSISGPGRAIDHMTQLLGDNTGIVFTLDKTCPDGTCDGIRIWYEPLANAAEIGRRRLVPPRGR